MVNPLSALLGIQGIRSGMQIFGLDPQSRAIKKEQDYFKNLLNQRRNAFKEHGGWETFNRIKSFGKNLPQALRRRQAGALSSRVSEEENRLSRALEASGATGASDLALRGRQRIAGNIEGMRSSGELGIAGLESQLANAELGSLGNVMGMLYPSPNVGAQGMAQSVGQYTDPLSGIQNVLMMAGMYDVMGNNSKISG